MRKAILRIIKKSIGKNAPTFDVFIPEKDVFGHYSTNAALRLSKGKRKDPIKTARELIPEIESAAPKGFFEKVEAAPPGFINFWLSRQTLQDELKKIAKSGAKYGHSAVGKNKRIQVEFVSANPTGPLTLANGRGGFLGNVLSNLLEFTGHKVEREYYVNDAGGQILTLGKSILAAAGEMPWEESFYKGEYIKKWAAKRKTIVKKHAASPMKLGQLAARDFLVDIKNVLSRKAGIKFDRWTSEEKDVRKKRLPEAVLKMFKSKKLIYEKDGAIWLKTSEFGDDKDRVLLTSDGNATYFLVDAGHYLETKNRGFQGKILILGPDHYGYVKRIQAVAKTVGIKDSQVIITQAILLMRKGKLFKISKRRGEFVTFEGLVDEVGVDAARFFMLSVTPATHMNFDLGLAKEKSMKNPVYYAQYAYVRAKNILNKTRESEKAGFKFLPLLTSEADSRLIRVLVRFPEVLADAAASREMHRLTQYAGELAAAFHNFYEKERVLQEEPQLRSARLLLVRASVIVMTNLFKILGISRPDKM